MHVALIGATRFSGSVLLRELLSRGHRMSELVRHPEKLSRQPNRAAEKVGSNRTARARFRSNTTRSR